MSEVNSVTPREAELSAKISETYNSGNGKKAVEMAIDFLREFPESRVARYQHAVMHGDYSVDIIVLVLGLQCWHLKI